MTIIFHDFIKAGVVMTGILTDNAIVEMICNTNNDCGINEIVKRMRNLLKNGQKNIDLIRIPHRFESCQGLKMLVPVIYFCYCLYFG